MKACYKRCIFTFDELPHPKKRGKKGEHVIPKKLYGSWKIKDVSPAINQQLGGEVDQLIFEDRRIVEVSNKLPLSRLQDEILKRSKISGVGSIDGHAMGLKYDNGKLKPRTKYIQENKLLCGKSDTLLHLKQKWNISTGQY